MKPAAFPRSLVLTIAFLLCASVPLWFVFSPAPAAASMSMEMSGGVMRWTSGTVTATGSGTGVAFTIPDDAAWVNAVAIGGDLLIGGDTVATRVYPLYSGTGITLEPQGPWRGASSVTRNSLSGSKLYIDGASGVTLKWLALIDD